MTEHTPVAQPATVDDTAAGTQPQALDGQRLASALHEADCGWNCYGHGLMQETVDAKYRRMADEVMPIVTEALAAKDTEIERLRAELADITKTAWEDRESRIKEADQLRADLAERTRERDERFRSVVHQCCEDIQTLRADLAAKDERIAVLQRSWDKARDANTAWLDGRVVVLPEDWRAQLREDLKVPRYVQAAEWCIEAWRSATEIAVGDRVEWNPQGDRWEPGVVTGVNRHHLVIVLDDNGQSLTVERRHVRRPATESRPAACGDEDVEDGLRYVCQEPAGHAGKHPRLFVGRARPATVQARTAAVPERVVAAARLIRQDIYAAMEVLYGEIGGMDDTAEDVQSTTKAIADGIRVVLDWVEQAATERPAVEPAEATTEVERLTTFLHRAGFEVCTSCSGRCGYPNGGVCGDCGGEGIVPTAEEPEDPATESSEANEPAAQAQDPKVAKLAADLHDVECGWNCPGHGLMQEIVDAKYLRRAAAVLADLRGPAATPADEAATEPAEETESYACTDECRDEHCIHPIACETRGQCPPQNPALRPGDGFDARRLYESCVLDASGHCSRGSHTHDTPSDLRAAKPECEATTWDRCLLKECDCGGYPAEPRVTEVPTEATETAWKPGDPVYPFKPDYECCSQCETTWTAGGPKVCPECGSPAIGATPEGVDRGQR